jgi:hypothetical protein
MATQITISAINYTNSPAVDETWTFEYKLLSASTYTLISNSSLVHANGLLAVPLTVTGLTSGQAYILQASPNCSSPALYFYETFNT